MHLSIKREQLQWVKLYLQGIFIQIGTYENFEITYGNYTPYLIF